MHDTIKKEQAQALVTIIAKGGADIRDGKGENASVVIERIRESLGKK